VNEAMNALNCKICSI